MVVSAILHGGDFIHVTFPAWFTNIAMVALGAVSGSRFAGTPFRENPELSRRGDRLVHGRDRDRRGVRAGGHGGPVAAHLRRGGRLCARLDRRHDDPRARAPSRPGVRRRAPPRRVFTVTLALPIVVRAVAPPVAKKTASGGRSGPRATGSGIDLSEQEIARDVFEVADRFKRENKAVAIAAGEALDRNRIRRRHALLQVLDLLRHDPLEKNTVSLGEAIEIELTAKMERLDARKPRLGRPLHHVMANREGARGAHDPEQPGSLRSIRPFSVLILPKS